MTLSPRRLRPVLLSAAASAMCLLATGRRRPRRSRKPRSRPTPSNPSFWPNAPARAPRTRNCPGERRLASQRSRSPAAPARPRPRQRHQHRQLERRDHRDPADLLGGRVLAQREIAKATIRAGRAGLAGVESNTLLSAVTALHERRAISRWSNCRANQIDVLSRQRQAAQDRFDVGEITRTDVAQADAARCRARRPA